MSALMKTVASGTCTMEEVKGQGIPPCGCAKAALAVLESPELAGCVLTSPMRAQVDAKCGAQGAESLTSISWPELFSSPAKGGCASVMESAAKPLVASGTCTMEEP